MIKKVITAGLLSAITITSALAADGDLNIRIPDIKQIIPPPPKPGSLLYQNDMDISHATFFVKDAKRYKLATSDAYNNNPEGYAKVFRKAFGHTISQQDTPVILKIFAQLKVAERKASKPVKAYYHRIRPFVYFHEKPCKPSKHINTSYPSGHTSSGWLVALTLSQINPARATEIMKRGYEFGQSRIICGSHWPSDVNGGYLMGSVVFSQMQTSPEFQKEIQLAKQEIAQK